MKKAEKKDTEKAMITGTCLEEFYDTYGKEEESGCAFFNKPKSSGLRGTQGKGKIERDKGKNKIERE